MTTKKGGPGIFFTEEKRGPLLFFQVKKGAATFFHNHNLGGQYFLRTIFGGAVTFLGEEKGRPYIFSPISDFPISFPRKLRH